MQIKSFSKERFAQHDSETVFVKLEKPLDRVVFDTKNGEIEVLMEDGMLIVHCNGGRFMVSPRSGNQFSVQRTKR